MMETTGCSQWGTQNAAQMLKSSYFVDLETSSDEDGDIQEATQQLEGNLPSNEMLDADDTGGKDLTSIKKLNRKLTLIKNKVGSGEI